MPLYTDQLNRVVEVPETPKRIISLVPSQTELLFDLGLDEEVIGITKFCIHPEAWFRNKTKVGGTKTVKMDVMHSLQPDLIIASKEENVKEQVTELERIAPVWISDIGSTADAFSMIHSIGGITGKEPGAESMIAKIKKDFAGIALLKQTFHKKIRTAYLIWKDPYITIGNDTFIHDMLQLCGLENVFSATMRYPQISAGEIKSTNAELVLLSSEPYPFKQKHIDELQAIVPGARIMLVDGEIFSWYGSRMQYAAGYLNSFLKEVNK